MRRLAQRSIACMSPRTWHGRRAREPHRFLNRRTYSSQHTPAPDPLDTRLIVIADPGAVLKRVDACSARLAEGALDVAELRRSLAALGDRVCEMQTHRVKERDDFARALRSFCDTLAQNGPTDDALPRAADVAAPAVTSHAEREQVRALAPNTSSSDGAMAFSPATTALYEHRKPPRFFSRRTYLFASCGTGILVGMIWGAAVAMHEARPESRPRSVGSELGSAAEMLFAGLIGMCVGGVFGAVVGPVGLVLLPCYFLMR